MFVASLLLATMLQGGVAAGPRQDYVACLKTAETEAMSRKVGADAFAAFAHQHCATIEQGLKAELMKFGLKNGMSRKMADEDAQLQVDDYVFTAEERYRYHLEKPKPE